MTDPSRGIQKAVLLLSGGIDSPVAGQMLADQGVELVGLHASLEPVTGPESVEKAKELAKGLGLDTLYVVRIGEAMAKIPADQEAHRFYFVFQKRFLYRMAERLAAEVGADAIVTGENLGQVSSQTLRNLATIEMVAERPILRPLLGLDKVDIIEFARENGSYETSVGPELCDLLGPDKPATVSIPGPIEEMEARIGLDVDLPPMERLDLHQA